MIRYTTIATYSRRSVQATLACCLLLALLLAGAGCGGGSSSSGTPSRFAGTYSGSFVQNASPLNIGTINLTLDSSGNLTGNAANGGGNGTSTLTGSVNGAGNGTINVVNSDSTHDSATGAFTFNSAGDLVGAFKNVAGNTITVTAATSSKPLLYAGNFTRSDGSGSGTVNVTITTAGVLTGSALNGASNTSLTGTVSGVGITSITATNSSGTSVSSGAAGFDSTGKLLLEIIDTSGVITTLTLTTGIQAQ